MQADGWRDRPHRHKGSRKKMHIFSICTYIDVTKDYYHIENHQKMERYFIFLLAFSDRKTMAQIRLCNELAGLRFCCSHATQWGILASSVNFKPRPGYAPEWHIFMKDYQQKRATINQPVIAWAQMVIFFWEILFRVLIPDAHVDRTPLK